MFFNCEGGEFLKCFQLCKWRIFKMFLAALVENFLNVFNCVDGEF